MRRFLTWSTLILIVACQMRDSNPPTQGQAPIIPALEDTFEGSMSPVRGQAQKISLMLVSSHYDKIRSQTANKNSSIDFFFELTTEYGVFPGLGSVSRQGSQSDSELSVFFSPTQYESEDPAAPNPRMESWRSFVASLNIESPCPQASPLIIFVGRLEDKRIEGIFKATGTCGDGKTFLEEVSSLRMTRTGGANYRIISDTQIETQNFIYESTPVVQQSWTQRYRTRQP